MMDNFFASQLSAKNSFHHDAMFVFPFAFRRFDKTVRMVGFLLNASAANGTPKPIVTTVVGLALLAVSSFFCGGAVDAVSAIESDPAIGPVVHFAGVTAAAGTGFDLVRINERHG